MLTQGHSKVVRSNVSPIQKLEVMSGIKVVASFDIVHIMVLVGALGMLRLSC